ncbi:unnamed protein product [Didymodactylos carnosus]|uniref:Uncharacterized protein n=2 Tax=Didymodactylos carnosus TaxID=1234261 RepID=A0A814UPU9_9BILA|nr:unnamed protein product [Didymodactylos carnosus]CAF3940351.1 unnamed protein product [Didymodactylos carnosus]
MIKLTNKMSKQVALLPEAATEAWGTIGHSLVAQIAQTYLTESSSKFVRDLLPWYTAGNLSMLSSWPDTIIYPDTNPVDYLNWQWSPQLHYVNTPDWMCKYDQQRDCQPEQRCIDGSIQNYTSRLADWKQDFVQRQEALKFLVHFVGDAHQPLHAGFTSDRGGNSIKGNVGCRFFGKSTNLHSLWDTVMIERKISTDFFRDPTKYFKYLLNLMHTKYAVNISQWSKCPSEQSQYLACSALWIQEDSDLNCALVYRDADQKPLDMSYEFDLGEDYYQTRMIIVEQRLIQGGLRLGLMLNLLDDYICKHPNPDAEQEQQRVWNVIQQLFGTLSFI